VIDITERRNAEVETQGLRQELTHISRVATMCELTASIAHELNQPLAAILTNAQAGLRSLASDNPDLSELRDILADIVADDQRAAQVIRRLRSLLTKENVERRPLRVNDLVDDIVSVVRTDALLRNIAIVFDLAPRLPLVLGDRIQLQQVILNLVINAFDAMAEVADHPRKLTLRTRPVDDNRVQVDVVDTGPGIAPDRLDWIFEPFMTTKRAGMGMGLSVSRSIVRAHNGDLRAESSLDGATFRLVLPAVPDGTPGPEAG
jgi:two-component system sensor kinase FixL